MKMDVLHLARLSKLRFSEEELAQCEKQMEQMVSMLKSLPEAEEGTVASSSAFSAALRPDRAEDSLSREELFRNAPVVEQGGFSVPPILEEGS